MSAALELAVWTFRFADAAKAEETPNAGQQTDDHRLRRYWTVGEGAALIDWFTPGALDRAEEYLSEHVTYAAALARSYWKDVRPGVPYSADQAGPRAD
jgi:hypothetical protein